MTAIELLLWASSVWSAFFLYCLCDAPTVASVRAAIRWKRGCR